jgi:release factor glutamine methyltransferase
MEQGHWLQATTNKLSERIAEGVTNPRLDSLLLLELVTNKNRAHLLAHPETILSKQQINKLTKHLNKRLQGQPMAYILGNKEFYGHTFIVNKNVLIPRPESEIIIEVFKRQITSSTKQILDIGTGSGCLAITAKLAYPRLCVHACDVSSKALQVATSNGRLLGANVTFFKSNLLANIATKYDVIIANLPYIPNEYKVSSDVLAEPKIALFSGPSGLALIKKLLSQCHRGLNPGGLIIIESLPFQHSETIKLAHNNGLVLVDSYGLVQAFAWRTLNS